MIALRPAFDAPAGPASSAQILHEEPPPLRKLDPRVPRDLETIIHKAMAKDIAARYASAADLAEDLRLFLEDRPLRPRAAARRSERAWRWCRRNPAVATLSAAAASLMIAVLTVSTVSAIVFGPRPRRSRSSW